MELNKNIWSKLAILLYRNATANEAKCVGKEQMFATATVFAYNVTVVMRNA